MRLLCERIALRDIADVESFVRAHLRSANVRTRDLEEHDDLVCEGIAILYELDGKFEDHRTGYAQAGKFSGFAAYYLPKRLGDRWHAGHPEHRREQDRATGKRKWVYLNAAVSLDGMQEDSRRDSAGGTGGTAAEARILPRRDWTPIEALAEAS